MAANYAAVTAVDSWSTIYFASASNWINSAPQTDATTFAFASLSFFYGQEQVIVGFVSTENYI